ncbi:protein unc-13 homolog B-like isoform X12 [Elysia marginata]|uniref:Protein unc-13 homolog B-like isoform X12 n=1 Tax=Elysia marginata TaxID=1093978 RepID=A0AAV4FNJ5_9GAST|nr:protein unc-13 homolog B-like isoform X12 [Elysia marginata]
MWNVFKYHKFFFDCPSQHSNTSGTAGMSEDSDYTSDINYPVQHQHNTSAHQYRGVHPHPPGSGPDDGREDDDPRDDGYHHSSYRMRSADSRETLRYDDSFDGNPLDSRGHERGSRDFEDDSPHHHGRHRRSSFDPIDPLDQLGPRSPDRGSLGQRSYEDDYYYQEEDEEDDDYDGRGSSRGMPHNLHHRRGYDGDRYDDDSVDDDDMEDNYYRHHHHQQETHRRHYSRGDMNENAEGSRGRHHEDTPSGPYHQGRSDTDSDILFYNSRPSSRPPSFIQDSPVLSHHSSINISRQSTQDYSPANSHVSSSNVSRQSTTHESSFDTFEKSDSSAHPMSSPARSRWLEAFNRVCAELSESRGQPCVELWPRQRVSSGLCRVGGDPGSSQLVCCQDRRCDSARQPGTPGSGARCGFKRTYYCLGASHIPALPGPYFHPQSLRLHGGAENTIVENMISSRHRFDISKALLDRDHYLIIFACIGDCVYQDGFSHFLQSGCRLQEFIQHLA